MIRQAISCDICGTEKRQTNHWFVAYEQAGELRVSGWTSRHRLRADSKHLCGQTCLHKLVDQFMAKSIALRARPAPDEDTLEPVSTVTDGSLTSTPTQRDIESSARLLTPILPAAAKNAPLIASVAAPIPKRLQLENLLPIPAEPQRYGSRSWHAEAWQRERERELRATENHPEIAARRRAGPHCGA
ncbi:MAG: hypothetical protein WBP71_23120 [Terracidiphilus sp.]